MTTPGRATPVGYVLTAVAIGVLVFLAGAVAGAGHNAPVATSPEDMFVAVGTGVSSPHPAARRSSASARWNATACPA